MHQNTLFDRFLNYFKNHPILVIPTIIFSAGILLSPIIKDFIDTYRAQNIELEQQKNHWIEFIEDGKKCKEELIQKKLEKIDLSFSERYECFKLDSIGCVNLEKFIYSNSTNASAEAANYLILHFSHKETTNNSIKELYRMKIRSLSEKRDEILKEL